VTDDGQAESAPDWLAVVTMPTTIDTAATRRLCGQLGSALASATTVIADMTATTSCDSAAVRLLLLAQEQAAATGVELRLVVPSAAVLRVLAATGADWLLPVYPRLEDALAPGTHARATGSATEPRRAAEA
jgi:anti-sigma B factor antagonist